MTLEEIKTAVLAGKTVHWVNSGYEVIRHIFKDTPDGWYILHWYGSCVGLTYKDGVTLNGKESDFYIKE